VVNYVGHCTNKALTSFYKIEFKQVESYLGLESGNCVGCQWLEGSIFIKGSSFVFRRLTKVLRVWNVMRVS